MENAMRRAAFSNADPAPQFASQSLSKRLFDKLNSHTAFEAVWLFFLKICPGVAPGSKNS